MQSSRQSARSTRSEPPLAQRDLLTRLVRARPLFLAAAFFLLGCMLERMCDLPVPAGLKDKLAHWLAEMTEETKVDVVAVVEGENKGGRK